MKGKLIETSVGLVLTFTFAIGRAEKSRSCIETGPPSIWAIKSPYPFQAGAERTFDELYHGPWRARVDIALYSEPRGQHVVGEVRRGTVVKALVAESIVVHPIRLIASKDFEVTEASSTGRPHFGTVRKGEALGTQHGG